MVPGKPTSSLQKSHTMGECPLSSWATDYAKSGLNCGKLDRECCPSLTPDAAQRLSQHRVNRVVAPTAHDSISPKADSRACASRAASNRNKVRLQSARFPIYPDHLIGASEYRS